MKRTMFIALAALSVALLTTTPALAAKNGNGPAPKADVAIEALAWDEHKIDPGALVELQWRVRNTGPAGSGVTVHIPLPEGFDIRSPCYNQYGTGVCPMGYLAAGSDQTLTVPFVVGGPPRTVAVAATASSSEADPNANNNTATHQVMVTASTYLPATCVAYPACAIPVYLESPARLKLTVDARKTSAGKADLAVEGAQPWSQALVVADGLPQSTFVDLAAGEWVIHLKFADAVVSQRVTAGGNDLPGRSPLCMPHHCDGGPTVPRVDQTVRVNDGVGNADLIVERA